MHSQAHWTLLSFLKSANGIWQQVSKTAVDYCFSICVQEGWGEVRRSCVLQLKQIRSLEVIRVRMEGAALCYGFLDHGFFFWKLFPIRKMTYQHEVWLRSSGVQLDCLFKRNDSLRNLAWSVQLDVCRCDRCLQRVASDCTEPSQVGLRLLDVYCGMCLSNKLGTWVEHRHR